MPRPEPQHLIFDADDTLWENNIYFEQAFEHFFNYLNHSSMSSVQVRAVLDEIEIVNAKLYGYGSRNFARNLRQCFEHLAERQVSDTDLDAVQDFAYAILDRPIELIDGVAETIAELSARHDLTIFTKGDPEEQRLKIDRSGLNHLFNHYEIVREKNAEAYRSLVEMRGFDPERTWMVGNSPKSDINPALSVGLRAVFVPHAHTWSLEHEDVPPEHPRLIRVESFRDLARHF